MTALTKDSGEYKFAGFGHQKSLDVKTLEVVKTTLEEAYSHLPQPCKFAELSGFINRAIEEAQGLIIAADDHLNDNK
jgi:hypothetical protein